MNNLVKYQTAIDKVSDAITTLSAETLVDFKCKSTEFMNDVQDSQYVKVPLVGGFSAGKSSLLNVFTKKPGMLPVDTMPETAIAYELYYSETECVELYRDGNKIDTKPLDQIKQLDTKPGDVAKVYCNSEPIKQLMEQGIILVDMPGIGSGIERHDAAIFHYIQSGNAFILMVDAEQGSLRGNTLAFMDELSKYGMFPAVFVSKIDKKPEGDVKNIVEYIQYQLTRLGNEKPFVSTLCAVNENIGSFNNYINSLNAEAIIAQKLGRKLRLIVESLISQVNVNIELRGKDISNVDDKIKQIEEEIANVKAELPNTDGKTDSPEKSTDDIMENVLASLEAKSGDIAQMIIDREDEEGIKSVIVSTIRSAIISSLKEESEQYTSSIGTVVQDAFSGIAAIEIDNKILDDFLKIYDVLNEYIEKLLLIGGKWAKIISVVLPFLPDLMKWLFGKSDSEVLEEVRLKVMSKCKAQVTINIRPIIYEMVSENQAKIKERFREELVAKMESVKAALNKKKEDASKSKDEVELEIKRLGEIVNNLKEIVAEYC